MRGPCTSCVVFVLLTAASVAVGQAYIRQGNVLDANMRMGSGGVNRSVPGYKPGMTNRIMTGNVTGGVSFRGFSPVGDPSRLFGIGSVTNVSTTSVEGIPSTGLIATRSLLPSDRLSDFRRDSYNVHDYAATDDRRVHRPYFSSASTITNVRSILAGLNRPGTSQLKSPYTVPDPGLVPKPTDPLATDDKSPSGTLLGVPNYIARGTGSLLSGVENGALLKSTLMGRGQVWMLPVPGLVEQAKANEALRPVGIQPIDRRVATFEPMDLRVVQPGGVDRRLAGGGMGPGPARPGEGFGERQTVLGVPDLYSAMVRQRGGSLVRPYGRPADTEEGDTGSALLKGRSTVAQPVPRVEAQQRIEAEREAMLPSVPPADVPAQPLRTFVGSEQSQLNEYLDEAEALLHAGRYYQAAGQYELAQTVAPDNPLPLLGWSTALLAAGEYLSSANHLFHAIRLFDSLALYDLDMKAFIPDLAMLDRRRADLEQRLERHEVFKLRFLLGYAEYCSGLERLGLADLEKAVADAPEEWSYLHKFVDTLRTRHPDLTRPIDVKPGS